MYVGSRPRWAGAALVALMGSGLAASATHAQALPTAPAAPVTTPSFAAPPATASTAPNGVALVPPAVQVVRFTVPEGVRIDVLAPPPDPAPIGDGRGSLTVGLRVGTTYRLRLSNLPGRPGAELYPVVDMIGHLHRPTTIDPGQFPIRILLRDQDIEDAVDRARLITQVVYLEDPELAVPIPLPKDEIPNVDLAPSENPLKVAAALGRVMAIVQLGARTPSPEELALPPGGVGIMGTRCPFASHGTSGGPCGQLLGPVCGTPPPPDRPWMPKDEYLCDGGDHAAPARFGGEGGLRGIDPRDAVIRFSRPRIEQLLPELERLQERYDRREISAETFGIESRRLSRAADGDYRPRVLPTNVVCIYAPRFASVRASLGSNEALRIQALRGAERLQRGEQSTARQEPVKFVKNEPPVINRHRVRPSGAISRVGLRTAAEVRVLSAFDLPRTLAANEKIATPGATQGRQAPGKIRTAESAIAIKTAEGVVVQGRAEGAGQTLMAWKPQEMAGVEVPPNQPGLAVLKRASASVAEPGDQITFSIQYRNMGNVPISDVSIIDSLLPRFEYVAGSAKGPEGAVFAAAENRVGAMELRWDLPGVVAPGAEGYVSFEVMVR